MKIKILLFSAVFCLSVYGLYSQTKPVHPAEIIRGKYLGVSRALRDIPAMTKADFNRLVRKGEQHELNEKLEYREYPFAATALPKGQDPVRQNFMGNTKNALSGPIANWEGQSSPYTPSDCNGVCGPNHFMQTINCVYAIYTKDGTLVAGPTQINQIFGSVPGSNNNDGDPIILYDEQADRWVVTEFSITGSPNYVMMAISTTNDPTGTYYQYSFQVSSMPDYPKFSVWPDGYYMGDNNTSGNDIYVFERNQMLNGLPAQAVGFNNSWRPAGTTGFMCVPPVDNDGDPAPAGSPGLYIAFNDDGVGGGTDQLWIWELAVDWTNTAASTFNRVQQIDVPPFSSFFDNNWNNIEQKGTGQRLDAIPQVIMNVPQYRNFGSYQTIVCCHTVNTNGVRLAGIRWYELRKTGTTWEIRQQGTYAPDTHSRWLGSIQMNGSHELGLGYSISSTSMYPSIRYCGQSAMANAAANGILDIAEDSIWMATNSQSGTERWGDYSQISVDPADDKTFWYTNQYGGNRHTRIASFKFNIPPTVVTVAADSVTTSTAHLHGSINPNGVATTYFFRYGTSPFSMTDSTAVDTAGSGINPVDVTAPVSGLTNNTKYYFRVFASSMGGNASGTNLNFTTLQAPFLAVAPSTRNVPQWAGNTEFYVNSNTTWNAASDAPWCTLTDPGSGTGNDTIKLVYADYNVVGGRVANITVTGANVGPQTVTVVQEGPAATLSVSPPNRNVPCLAGNTEFTVTSNTTWTVVSNAAWCTVTPSGSMNGTITATYEENTGQDPRVCTVTVTAPGIPSVEVTVTQERFTPSLSVTPPNRDVSADAGSTAFTVTANVSWTAVSDLPWCTVTPSGSGNGTIVADFTVNPDHLARMATISVTGASLPVRTVTVTQAKSTIGIGETAENDIAIFPNPTTGVFRVVTGHIGTAPMKIAVQDMTGKQILEQSCKGEKEYTLDLSPAPQGTYHLIIRTDEKVVVKKLVVIR